MRQDLLRPPKRATRKRKRIGRGDASGNGSFSGRGMKGQKSRGGSALHASFEGGQLPLAKALPMMRGFTNIFRKQYQIVNLNQLAGFSGDRDVTPHALAQAGLVKSSKKPIKILGRGELTGALVVEADKFSGSAREKIEAAGGSVRAIG
jgi:large subunit ribosomal protein L15